MHLQVLETGGTTYLAVCGKRVTLADEVNTRRSAGGTEEADGMLSGSGSGLGAIPLPNVGSMGGECEPLRSARHRGRGYAVETRTIGGVFMKSAVVKRSIVVAGHKTSVSLEDAFWNGLKEIARERRMTLSALVAEIDAQRQLGNLSSALRLDFYRTQLSHPKGGHAANHEMIGDTAPALS